VSPAPRVVVLGMMGRTPYAGVAWQVLHFVEGLRRVGCDVHYVEDTGSWPYDPEQNAVTGESAYTVRHIGRLLEWMGLTDRWAYVAPDGEVHGLSREKLASVLRGADALVNLTGATVLRDEHLRVPVRIYLETDPVRPQIEIAQGRRFTIDLLAAHTHHFSFGENLGAPNCPVPIEGFHYRPTRQPVVLDWWPPGPSGDAYTTVASWHQDEKDIRWRGETYFWSKDREFVKFLDLPKLSGLRLELALACDDAAALDMLRAHGWGVLDGHDLSLEIEPYRRFILGSRAEFTVAKDQNVRLRSGWFSDRSACYLAAGKPVITQDTGFGDVLPTGSGLFAFRTTEEALAAVEAIEGDFSSHSRAAHELAAEHFAAERVLGTLLEQCAL
jgi:hypothetical protein